MLNRFCGITEHSEQELMRAQLEQQPTGIRLRKAVLEQYDDTKEALTLDDVTGALWLTSRSKGAVFEMSRKALVFRRPVAQAV